jgi:hypothetical protein
MVADIIFMYKDHFIIDAYKMVIRVSVPFTEDHYYGKGRPNTELAYNSPFISRRFTYTESPVLVSQMLNGTSLHELRSIVRLVL